MTAAQWGYPDRPWYETPEPKPPRLDFKRLRRLKEYYERHGTLYHPTDLDERPTYAEDRKPIKAKEIWAASYDEIGEAMGVSKNAIQAIERRAIQKLRARIDPENAQGNPEAARIIFLDLISHSPERAVNVLRLLLLTHEPEQAAELLGFTVQGLKSVLGVAGVLDSLSGIMPVSARTKRAQAAQGAR